MAISKKKKQEFVATYVDLLNQSQGVILTENNGMSVAQLQELRNTVRQQNGAFHVAKNTLTAIAMKEAGMPVPEDLLQGTTVVGFAFDNMPGIAKTITEFAKKNEQVVVKGAVMDGNILSPADVKALADLPSMDELRASFLGVLNAPATQIAGVLNSSVSQVVRVIKAYSEKDGAEAAA